MNKGRYSSTFWLFWYSLRFVTKFKLNPKIFKSIVIRVNDEYQELFGSFLQPIVHCEGTNPKGQSTQQESIMSSTSLNNVTYWSMHRNSFNELERVVKLTFCFLIIVEKVNILYCYKKIPSTLVNFSLFEVVLWWYKIEILTSLN